jgi:hypothetical protein
MARNYREDVHRPGAIAMARNYREDVHRPGAIETGADKALRIRDASADHFRATEYVLL